MRFHLIDALRGIAAIWVVFYHAYEGSHVDGLIESLPDLLVTIVFRMGHAGVPIFFVISGFVIAHSLRHDKVDIFYLGKFTLRRSIRLDPPYWASIIFVLFLAWVSSKVKNELMPWPSTETLIAHVFYLQGFFEFKSINSVFWTLCLEIQFYLIFCLLVAISQFFENYFKQAKFIIFGSAAIISMLWPLDIIKENLHPGLFLPHWHAFLLGVFAYWSWQKRMHFTLFYIYSLPILISSILGDFSFSIFATITAIFVHELSKIGYLESMNWKWLQFLGLISYSLYLTHNPISGAVFFIAYEFIGHSITSQFIALGIVVISCVSFACIYWWAFESWSIKLSKKIKLHSK